MTFALRNRIRLLVHQTCISFIDQLSTMAPRNLLQDTVKYNRKITLIRKMLKSRKCSQSLLSLRSTQSTQSGMSARVPVEPIKAIRKYLSSTKDQAEPQVTEKSRNKCDQVLDTPMAEVRQNYETVLSWLQPSGINTSRGNIHSKNINTSRGNIRSKKPRSTTHSGNHVLYTPMAEMRRNYETVLSWLCPSGINKNQGDLLPKKKHSNQILDLSDLPATQYRVPPEFVDEMLDSLTTSDRTPRSPSLSSMPDLSGLPSTRY